MNITWLVLISLSSFLLGGLLVWLIINKAASDKDQINVPQNERILQIGHETTEKNYKIALDDAIETEQKRIANELHDDTVQRLVALRFGLEQLLHYRLDERPTDDVKRLRKELDDIISTLRYLIKGLVQPRFDKWPIAHHVKDLVIKLSSMHHQKVTMEVFNPELEFKLNPVTTQELYYLIHETAHNYLKDSMGFQLNITLKWGTELVVNLKDNGQGLQKGRGYGLGMTSMHERAKRISAEIIFHSMFNGLNVLIKVKRPELQNSISQSQSN